MEMDIAQFVIFSIAVFRLTRLVVYDKITQWMRMPFMTEYEEKNEEGEVEIYLIPRQNGIRGWIGELLSCYWCTGIWSAMGLATGYHFLPGIAGVVILVLAAAGLASLLELIVQKNIPG